MNWFKCADKAPLGTCLEQHMVSCVCWVCQYCNWTCNWYFTIPCKQLCAFCSALQITSVVVKWNYNYKLLCLKTCNHYVVITFGFSITTTLVLYVHMTLYGCTISTRLGYIIMAIEYLQAFSSICHWCCVKSGGFYYPSVSKVILIVRLVYTK